MHPGKFGRLPSLEFWSGKRVVLTGHTGFKGAWLSVWLSRLGAEVTGVSLPANSEPALYNLLGQSLDNHQSQLIDIRDQKKIMSAIKAADPEIIIHMAAQSLVLKSRDEPVETFETNVMGSIYLMEAARQCKNVQTILMVTSDKVYINRTDGTDFDEDSPLGGDDPYSASKAANEIAVNSYARSFFNDNGVRVTTARAGNVIGGGDWNKDRIIPDIYRALSKGLKVNIRNPEAVRPWQWVCEPLRGYLIQIEDISTGTVAAVPVNYGPNSDVSVTVGGLARIFVEEFGLSFEDACNICQTCSGFEKKRLTIKPERAFELLGWRTALSQQEAVRWTANWYHRFSEGASASELAISQIEDYEAHIAQV